MFKPTSSTPLRVLTLSELYPNPGQPILGVFVERQVEYLRTLCDVTVVSPVRVFPHVRIWRKLGNPRKFLKAGRDWIRTLSMIPEEMWRQGMMVLYPRYSAPPKQLVHGAWGYFCYAFLRGKLKALHAKYRFDLIHAHYASPCGLVALLAKRWMQVPVIVSVHGADVTFTVKQNRLSASIVRRVLREADLVIVHSTWTASQIRRQGVSASRIRIVPLGGDPPEGVAVRKRSTEVPTLLSVGYLYEMKGHRYVLQALRQLMDQGYHLRYMIVGEGPERVKLERLRQSLKLGEAVTFVGEKVHQDVWQFYQACDIFVLPSVVEGFGVAFIEALTAGVPIVGCEGTGAPEDVRALGECVELVKPRDVNSLVKALKRLLDDPLKRQEMGRVGRDIARSHFTWARCAEATFEAYLEVVAARGRGRRVPDRPAAALAWDRQ